MVAALEMPGHVASIQQGPQVELGQPVVATVVSVTYPVEGAGQTGMPPAYGSAGHVAHGSAGPSVVQATASAVPATWATAVATTSEKM